LVAGNLQVEVDAEVGALAGRSHGLTEWRISLGKAAVQGILSGNATPAFGEPGDPRSWRDILYARLTW
jgi:translation initiation factor RLI1